MTRTRQNSTKSTLTPQQASVIAGLVRGATVTEATKQAEVDRSTYYLWLKSDANFVAEMNLSKQEQAESMCAQLRGLSETALATLLELLTNKDVPAAMRLKTAMIVLHSIRALEPEEIGTTDRDEIELYQLDQSLP
ncbi:MAG: hypothetical protein ABSC64_10130 [Candidatus Korobacteraceae bacterium]|jgi:hypothetical protein